MTPPNCPPKWARKRIAGIRARYDAACVGLACRAGGLILGKTTSAEFAGTQPTETANPHNTNHTPGGSSSGSAAAVADFMVPFALNIIPGGLILRPAAFCGIVGFKPTFGLYSTAGMKPAAHSFDTIGLLARSVRDVVTIHAAMMNDAGPNTAQELASPRFGFFPSHLWETVEHDMRAVEEALRGISEAKGTVAEIATPAGFETITQHRAVINAFERARGLAGEASSASRLSRRKPATCARAASPSLESAI